MCSYTAPLPSPPLFLLSFCTPSPSNISPPFYHVPSALYSDSHFLPLIFSFSPSLPQCSFVLRFNAPKQAFCVSPLRVSAGAPCFPFCLCCENHSQSCLDTHAHSRGACVLGTKIHTLRRTHMPSHSQASSRPGPRGALHSL